MRKTPLVILATAVLAAICPTPALGAPLTAFELIQDLSPGGGPGRDLTRVRSSDGTGALSESTDALIAGENLVDANFGINNGADVSYSHFIDWVLPSVGTVMSAVLTIKAWSPILNNDFVFADTIQLGFLNAGRHAFVTTSFLDGSLLSGILANRRLDILIDKNVGPDLDRFEVFSSQLDIAYEPVLRSVPTPEPASLLLLGTGLGVLATRARAWRTSKR